MSEDGEMTEVDRYHIQINTRVSCESRYEDASKTEYYIYTAPREKEPYKNRICLRCKHLLKRDCHLKKWQKKCLDFEWG